MVDPLTRPPTLAWMDAGSGHRAWLDQVTEPALEPELPICDPHHHLWADRWGPYLVDELHGDTGSGHNVQTTVYIEAAVAYRADGPEELRSVGETEFAAEQAKASEAGSGARVAAIVPFVDLRRGAAVEPVLDAHEQASAGLVRGVRHQAAWDPDPSVGNSFNGAEGLLADENFRDALRVMAKRGLVFDAWVYHPQLAELTDLARAIPELTVVAEHLGGPLGIGPYAGRRDEVRAGWRPLIAELATCPNVVMKLGGMGMGRFGLGWPQRPAPPSSEEFAAAWQPEVSWCIEQFGADRCMFESNFPVDGESISYVVLWNAYKRMAAGASAADKADLFRDTAHRVYRLG